MKISCKEASRLMSQTEDRALSPVERAALNAHLVVCKACQVAAEQIQSLRHALRRLFHGGE